MARFYELKSEISVDAKLGKWLKREREIKGLNTIQVYRLTEIKPHRLYELEWGIAERSITKREAQALAKAYEIAAEDIIRRALGDFSNEGGLEL